MRYLPKSPSERREMLDAIGVRSAEELFRSIPEDVSPAAAAEPAGTALRSRADPVFPGARGGKLAGLHKFSGCRRLQPFAVGGYRHDHPARRIPDLLHAVPGGNQPGHAAGDLRVSNADVRADRAGSGQRLDVGRLDGHDRGRADGRPSDGPPARAGGAVAPSRIPGRSGDLRAQFGAGDPRNRLHGVGADRHGGAGRRDRCRNRGGGGAVAEFSRRDRAGGGDRRDGARRGSPGDGGDCRRRFPRRGAAARRSRYRGARSAELRLGAQLRRTVCRGDRHAATSTCARCRAGWPGKPPTRKAGAASA